MSMPAMLWPYSPLPSADPCWCCTTAPALAAATPRTTAEMAIARVIRIAAPSSRDVSCRLTASRSEAPGVSEDLPISRPGGCLSLVGQTPQTGLRGRPALPIRKCMSSVLTRGDRAAAGRSHDRHAALRGRARAGAVDRARAARRARVPRHGHRLRDRASRRLAAHPPDRGRRRDAIRRGPRLRDPARPDLLQAHPRGPAAEHDSRHEARIPSRPRSRSPSRPTLSERSARCLCASPTAACTGRCVPRAAPGATSSARATLSSCTSSRA